MLTWPHGRPPWVTPPLEQWWSALDSAMSVGRFRCLRARAIWRQHVDQTNSCARALVDSLRRSEEGDEAWCRARKRRCGRDSGAAGGNILYEPASLVVHQVTSHRLTRRWIMRRGLAQGTTNARLQALGEPRGAHAVLDSCRMDARHARRRRCRSGQIGDQWRGQLERCAQRPRPACRTRVRGSGARPAVVAR